MKSRIPLQMREILFRGKRRDNDEWIYGCLLNVTLYGKTANLIFGDNFLFVGKDVKALNHALVDPETVGQFTGLTDKNGKRIFEGDVISFHKFRDEPNWIGVVCYENYHYIAVGRMPIAYEKRKNEKAFHSHFEVTLSGIDKTTIEVIGNIHDTPELIGERESHGE